MNDTLYIQQLRQKLLQSQIPFQFYKSMKSNSQWFQQSPFLNSSGLNALHLFRGSDHDNESQEMKNYDFYSPDAMNSTFRLNISNLSPFSKLLSNEQENKDENLSIPGLFTHTYPKNQVIKQKLIFSEDEDDEDREPVTPMCNLAISKEEHQQGELNTTGKKSEAQLGNSAKKSRPREKGLRKLSQRAFEIVQHLKNATYKQVAAKLVQQHKDYEFDNENREEQNIKRRVYDALNVLIALGVLRKDGRKIVSDYQENRKAKGEFEDKQYNILKQRLILQKRVLLDKKHQLRQTQLKLKTIESIMKRNKKEVFNESLIIKFPFVGMAFSESAAQVNLKAIKSKIDYKSQNAFSLKSKQRLFPFGDLDCFLLMAKSENLPTPQKEFPQKSQQFS